MTLRDVLKRMVRGVSLFVLVIAASCNSAPAVPPNPVCDVACAVPDPCLTGTTRCDQGVVVGCVVSGFAVDGTRCGSSFCTSGLCEITQCVPNAPCRPFPNECQDGSRVCGPIGCIPVGPLPNGTPCAAGAGVCSYGSCIVLRDVTGAFTTTYEKDDLSKNVVATPPPQGTTIFALVGTTNYPGIVFPDGTFSISQVPSGNYWLCISYSGVQSCVEHVANIVKLNTLVAARPDLKLASKPTPVTLDLTNLDPYAKDSLIQITSAQGGFNLRPFQLDSVMQPADGVTSASVVIDWSKGELGTLAAGLPDATKQDTVWVTLAPPQSVGTGGAVAQVSIAKQYAKLTDWTVLNGVASSENVPLVSAPQTGSAKLDIRYSQFGALPAKVNPKAVATHLYANVFAHPDGITYPDQTTGRGSVVLLSLYKDLSAGTGGGDGGVIFADYDYGSFAYGQFLKTNWMEFTYVAVEVAVTFTAAGATPATWRGGVSSSRPGAFNSPIGLGVRPPQSPKVNLLDGFSPQANVNFMPTISWNPPAIGNASSYSVRVVRVDAINGATVLTPVFDLTLYSSLSFRIPPGVLVKGATYFADIVANAASWYEVDASGTGVPYDTADCITATFSP